MCIGMSEHLFVEATSTQGEMNMRVNQAGKNSHGGTIYFLYPTSSRHIDFPFFSNV
jgi:hypothetical protein